MIFEEQISRKPDNYPWARVFIQAMWDNPWNVSTFNFNPDVQDFKVELTEEERGIVLRTLSAISQIETSVKSFWQKLPDNLPQLRDLGCVMSNVETVHNFAYEKLLDVLGMNEIFEENLKVSVVAGRVNYLRKYTHKYYTDSKKQYVYALTLFTLFVENVSLFSQFYIMNWLSNNKNIFKTVNQQILYTKSEEQIHFLVGAKIINVIREEYPELFDGDLVEKILKEADEAVKHEIKLCGWILQGYDRPKLNEKVLAEFIKNRMNMSLEMIQFPKLYEIDPDLEKEFIWFEEEVIGSNFVDFFNQRSTDYSRNNQSFTEEDLF